MQTDERGLPVTAANPDSISLMDDTIRSFLEYRADTPDKLGRMLADSLVDVLVNGKAIKEVGIKMDPEPVLVLNMETASALGVEPPVEILGTAQIVE